MTPTIVDQITEKLWMRIVAGEIPAGARLRQDEIASEFRSSHVPVREAFRRLEADGLVTSEPRRGVRVAQSDRAQHFETLEMRAVLEGLALFHAVAEFAPRDFHAVSDADTACGHAANADEWEEANRRFHALLIAPCPLPALLRTVRRLQMTSALSARALGGRQSGVFPRTDRDHKAILTALQAHDAEQCATLLTRHIRRGHLTSGGGKATVASPGWTRNR